MVLGLIASALVHGALLFYSGTTAHEAPEFNVKSGPSSVDMVFSSAAAAADNPEKKQQQNEQKQPERTEPEPDDTKETEKKKKPAEEATGDVSKNATEEPTKENPVDTAAKKTSEESSERQKKTEEKEDKQEAAPQAAQHAGVKWVEDVDYRRNPPPRYPTQARVRHQEGVVRLLVRIDGEGRPESIRLEESSGYRLLDRAARKAVRRWRFKPAKKNGSPDESMTVVPVKFSLDR